MYTANDNAFATVETELEAYCLGVIMTDAWFSTPRRCLSIAVTESDVETLERLRTCVGSNAPYRTKRTTGGYAGSKPLIELNISRKQIIANLTALGVKKPKANQDSIPNIPTDLAPHLVRGIFDGDGSVCARQFFLSGPEVFMLAVNDYIADHTGLRMTSSPCNGSGRLVGGRKKADILHWMYTDCTHALTRKHESYKANW